jgi:hypothetical protein
VYGHSDSGAGVRGETGSQDQPAVVGVQTNSHGSGAAIRGETVGGLGTAGYFDGNVVVTGHIEFKNADCAEEFGLSTSDVEPGTVMVIDDGETLRPSDRAYDRRVAGVVAGAGQLRPAVILGAVGHHKGANADRVRVALVGRVWCKVDADVPISVGDLLTTSPTPGHAMKVVDHQRGTGAVLGKALRSWPEGAGLIPILVSLQ